MQTNSRLTHYAQHPLENRVLQILLLGTMFSVDVLATLPEQRARQWCEHRCNPHSPGPCEAAVAKAHHAGQHIYLPNP